MSFTREVNQIIASRDDEVRRVIQHFEDQIKSTECRVHFWWEQPIQLVKEEIREFISEHPNGEPIDDVYSAKRWTEIGWSKVGRDWRLAKRDQWIKYEDLPDYVETVDKETSNQVALVDAPRMTKVEAAVMLEDFLSALLNHVETLNRTIGVSALSIPVAKEGS